MNYSNPKKKLIALFLAGSIFCTNALPLYAVTSNSKNDIRIENTDSTKVKSAIHKAEIVKEGEKEVKKTKSTSALSYNFIYYLISQFIKINPLSRPR